MRGTIEVVEMNDRVYGGEERTVKPTTPVRNELRDLVRNIGDGVGRLDVVQDP